MQVAVVFPGQGVQTVGMGRDVADRYPEARVVFEEADRALGFPLSRLCWEGPAEDLTLTYHVQPAIVTVSYALWTLLTRYGSIRPDYVAGHSLGEYTALAAAGALSFPDTVRLVYDRGRFMQEAVPVGVGTMAAVLGLSEEVVVEVCNRLNRPDAVVTPANFNAPDQVVIAGHRPAVEAAAEELKRRGARRIVFLQVSAPFHCVLMKPAEERMAERLDRVPWRDPSIPWLNNVNAEPITDGSTAREVLKRQITAPVLWTRIVRRLWELGVRTFVEVGPGRVLTGLIKRIIPDAECVNVNDLETLEAALRRWPR
ncbi:Malonyl CoA-acyl carrier protein transacylase [bacterium HR11]|nr:Malonyl CoA-acyl carrier protein transacylase [bacterium HR11]